MLRFLGYICFYSGIAFILHFAIMDHYPSLWLGIVLMIVGVVIILLTSRQNNRRGESGDWLDLLDILELPFELIGWLFKAVFKLFD